MPDSAVLLRGAVNLYQAPLQTITATTIAPTVPVDIPPLDAAPPSATWDVIAEDLISDDGVTLSHTETIEDEMVLNETVAIDDYRTAEQWMMNLSVKSWQAEVLQLAMNANAATTTAPTVNTVGYIRIPMRKGPSVHKQTILARINDAPYRVSGDTVITQIVFLRSSQRDGFESNLGPKQQGAMVNLSFMGLLNDVILHEVGYIDLTNAPAA